MKVCTVAPPSSMRLARRSEADGAASVKDHTKLRLSRALRMWEQLQDMKLAKALEVHLRCRQNTCSILRAPKLTAHQQLDAARRYC